MFGYKKKSKSSGKLDDQDNEEFKAYLIDYGLAHAYLERRRKPQKLHNGELTDYLKEHMSTQHIESTVFAD